MTSNHEEYSDDITLANLKYLVQIQWSYAYFCRKSNEGTWGN